MIGGASGIPRVDRVSFGPEYWLSSGMASRPTADALASHLKNTNNRVVGLDAQYQSSTTTVKCIGIHTCILLSLFQHIANPDSASFGGEPFRNIVDPDFEMDDPFRGYDEPDSGSSIRLYGLIVRDAVIGIDCSGCERIGAPITHADIEADENAIRITSDEGVITLQEAKLRSGGPAVKSTGANSVISLDRVQFDSWSGTAIELSAGSVHVSDSSFLMSVGSGSTTHFLFGSGTRQARVDGSYALGSWTYTDSTDPNILSEPLAIGKSVSSAVWIGTLKDVVHAPHRQVKGTAYKHVEPGLRSCERRGFRPLSDSEMAGSTQHICSFDDALVIQQALDEVYNLGGGVVRLGGRKLFMLRSQIFIPTGVELRGANDGHTYQGAAMSVICVYPEEWEQSTKSPILIGSGSGIRGLSVVYPTLSYSDLLAKTLDKLPSAFTIQSLGPNAWIVDVTLANSINAIDFGTNDNNGHVVDSVFLSSLRGTGIYINNAPEGGWIDSVQGNLNAWKALYSRQTPVMSVPGMNDGDIPWPAVIRKDVTIEPFGGGSTYDGDVDTSLIFGGVGVHIGNVANYRIVNTFMHGPTTYLLFQSTTSEGGAENLEIFNLGGEPGTHQIVASHFKSITIFNGKLRCGIPGPPNLGLQMQNCIMIEPRLQNAEFNLRNFITHSEPQESFLAIGGGQISIQQYYSVSRINTPAVVISGGASVKMRNVYFDKTRWFWDVRDVQCFHGSLASCRRSGPYWTDHRNSSSNAGSGIIKTLKDAARESGAMTC
jgi:hypothetical protein